MSKDMGVQIVPYPCLPSTVRRFLSMKVRCIFSSDKFNKVISVFHVSVLFLIMNVKVAVDP